MPERQMGFSYFGMKHCQALMLGFAYALDPLHAIALSYVTNAHRTLPRGTIPEERVREADYSMERKYKYFSIGLGRLLIAILILRVNNKYILLVITALEIVILLIAHSLFLQQGLEWLQYAFLVLEFVQSARFPLALNIISKWSTSTTITFMMWIFKGSIHSFSSFFYIFTNAFSYYGVMTATVYFSVIVKGCFCALWLTFGSGDPIHNVFISSKELQELREEHRLRLRTYWKHRAPLKGIFMTRILYGCFVVHISYLYLRTWDNQAFIHPFALYRQSGKWVPLFCFYLMIIAEGVVALLIDFLIKKNKTTVNNIRKTCAAISAWGGGSCLLLIGANLGREIPMQIFRVIFYMFYIFNSDYDSVLIMHAVSPNYFGYIHAIISFMAYFCCAVVPYLDQNLAWNAVEDPTQAMSLLLYFYGFFLYFACLILLLSGSCKRMDYDSYKAVPWKEDSIVSFP